MTFKLSKTSKLDGIKSWSLQAIATCPGSADGKGGLVDACSGCYATTGFYTFGAAKKVRSANHEDWQREGFVDDMVTALRKETHFRWFDSGDMYSIKLARKMYRIMAATPHVKHWLPTRMHKFTKFQPILDAMQALPNVMVRPSSDSVDGTFVSGVHGSVIFDASGKAPEGVTVCKAYEHDGKCSGCRACYSKSVPVIGYPSHGHKMKKVIMMKKVSV